MKAFIKGIEDISYSFHTWEKFSDWCEAAAISLAQPMYHDPELEGQYMRIAHKYGDDIRKFPELLSIVVEELSENPCDFLGSAFMQMDLGSHWSGQFFTPDPICEMMAKMNFEGAKLPEDGMPITVCEPACGAGGMIVHAAEALKAQGIDPQQHMHVVCQDISPVCFHMSYIQLSLLGISAEVCHGDTLAMKTWHRWRTFMSSLTGHTMESIE
ncbi:MAG: N-6 DNA methylase, partial [Smithella sp.]